MSVTLPLEIRPNVYYTIDEAAQLLRVRSEEVLEMQRYAVNEAFTFDQHFSMMGITLSTH